MTANRAVLRADDGATATEYVGVLVLAAAIVVALYELGLPGAVQTHVSTALCRIVGGECKTHPSTALPVHRTRTPSPPRVTPSTRQSPQPSRQARPVGLACTRGQSRIEQNRSTRVVGYRKDTKNFRQIDYGSDGKITETSGSQTGNGVDGRFGSRVNIKKGGGVSAGGGYVANTRVQTSLEFTGPGQRAAYRNEVARRTAALANRVAKDPEYARTHDVENERRKIALDVGRRLHVKRTTSKLSGANTVAGGDGSYGIGSAGSDEQESDAPMTGRAVNDNGTADAKDDITIETYESTVSSWSGNLDVAKNPLKGHVKGIEYGAGAKGTYEETQSYQVQKQYGRPTLLTITTRRGWTIEGEGGTDLSAKRKGHGRVGPKRSRGESAKKRIGNGEITVQKKVIDLRKDRAAYNAFRALSGIETPAGNLLWTTDDPYTWDKNVSPQVRQKRRNLRWHFDHYGDDLRQVYRRDYTSDGSSLDVTGGVQLGARDDSNSKDAWTLIESRRRDPRTGRWWPYTCAEPMGTGLGGGASW